MAVKSQKGSRKARNTSAFMETSLQTEPPTAPAAPQRLRGLRPLVRPCLHKVFTKLDHENPCGIQAASPACIYHTNHFRICKMYNNLTYYVYILHKNKPAPSDIIYTVNTSIVIETSGIQCIGAFTINKTQELVMSTIPARVRT